VGFEIFDKPNFGISDFVQRANYLRAVQANCPEPSARFDMVESARCDDRHAGEPLAGGQPEEATASASSAPRATASCRRRR